MRDPEIFTYNADHYCLDCLPVDPENDDVGAIFATDELDSYPVCCVCLEKFDYMNLTTEGVINESRTYTGKAQFDRFDIVSAHYLFCSEWYNGQSDKLYSRMCKILKYYKPGLSCDWFSLSDNAKYIYGNLMAKHKF